MGVEVIDMGVKTKEAPPPQPVENDFDKEMEQIKTLFPERHGEMRKICPLWRTSSIAFYRVNFWTFHPNRVERSYFLRVMDEGIFCDFDNRAVGYVKVESPV